MAVKTTGVIIAATVASLFATAAFAATMPAETTPIVHCMGINACKGQSSCKTAVNNCAGMNSCKGKGVLDVTKAQCKEYHGTIVED